ncbi:MAG: Bug family tripartite tricarboxylate transporter substrate binding protein [Lautropia sp.]
MIHSYRIPLARRRRLVAGAVALASLAAVPIASAQEWPAGKPITIIVPFTAGGNVDTTARLIAQKLGERLRQSVVVDNVPGAGGVIGAGKAVQAAPDGRTLLMGFEGPIAIAKSINPAAVKFDPATDLVPVALTTNAPMVIVAKPELPVATIDDLIALARKQPGKLGYATSGIGTVLHLAMEIAKERAGIQIEHVPYKGGAQIATDVMGNHVDLAVLVSTSVIPHVTSGKLKALAVTTAKRLPALPSVPALAESKGFEGFDIGTWTGLFAPAKTPPALVERINAEVNAVLALDEIRKRLAEGGATAGSGDAASFAAFVKREQAQFAQVIARAGIKE